MKKQFNNQLLKPLLILTALILLCRFLSRNFMNSETIVDYVNKNRAAAAENQTQAETPSTDGQTQEKSSAADGQIPEKSSAADGQVPEKSSAADGQVPEKSSSADGSTQEKLPAAGKTGEIRTDVSVPDMAGAAYETDISHIDNTKENVDGENTSMTQNNPDNTIAEVKTAPDIPAERTVYREGFYYEPLSEEIKARITGISYPVSASEAEAFTLPVINILEDDAVPAVSYDDLRYLSVLYYDFNGEVRTGELICNRGIADDLVEIFHELYRNEYRIEKIRLVDEYQADDTASITDNNTSCFNYRVVDGTTSLSKHALGCAIDINPFYNPYVVFNKNGSGETYISPPGSEIYVDRSKDFPYKIDESDLCYKLFTEHGFTWGGNWNSCKDYQHFQKVPD